MYFSPSLRRYAYSHVSLNVSVNVSLSLSLFSVVAATASPSLPYMHSLYPSLSASLYASLRCAAALFLEWPGHGWAFHSAALGECGLHRRASATSKVEGVAVHLRTHTCASIESQKEDRGLFVSWAIFRRLSVSSCNGRALDRQGYQRETLTKNAKMSKNVKHPSAQQLWTVFGLSLGTFWTFFDFLDVSRHFVMNLCFWAVQRFAGYKSRAAGVCHRFRAAGVCHRFCSWIFPTD